MADCPSAVPAWGQPLEPTDPVALAYSVAQAWCLAMARGDLAKRDQPAAAVEAQVPHHSNQWAVMPEHCAEGCALLLIDPHVPWHDHYRWYEAHLHGDRLHVAGFTMAGLPLMVMGFSEQVAWAFTAGGADSADVCEERLDAPGGDHYRYGEGWRDVLASRATINISEGAGMRQEERVLRYTHHGPILLEEGGRAFSFRSALQDDVGLLEQFYAMNCSRGLHEFKAALERLSMLPMNIMAADTQGNVYYVQNGRAPRRPDGYPTDRPVPGWLPEAEWGEPAPLAELPQIENPPFARFMQNCNVAAYLTTPEHRIDHTAFPAWLLHQHVGDVYRPRGYRATYLLHRQGIIGLPEARRIAMDSYVVAAEPWIAALLDAAEAQGPACPDPTGRREEALSILRRWDGYARVDSVGPAIFKYWRLEYHKLRPAIDAENEHLNIPRTAEDRRAALAALDRAVATLLDKFGSLEIPWGEVKRLRRGEQSWPLSGDAFSHLGMRTLRATEGWDPAADGRFYSQAGNSCTTLAFMKEPVTAYSITPYGQSDDPASPHYADQAPLFSAEQFKPMWFGRAALEGHIEETTLLLR